MTLLILFVLQIHIFFIYWYIILVSLIYYIYAAFSLFLNKYRLLKCMNIHGIQKKEIIFIFCFGVFYFISSISSLHSTIRKAQIHSALFKICLSDCAINYKAVYPITSISVLNNMKHLNIVLCTLFKSHLIGLC